MLWHFLGIVETAYDKKSQTFKWKIVITYYWFLFYKFVLFFVFICLKVLWILIYCSKTFNLPTNMFYLNYDLSFLLHNLIDTLFYDRTVINCNNFQYFEEYFLWRLKSSYWRWFQQTKTLIINFSIHKTSFASIIIKENLFFMTFSSKNV